MAVCQQGERWSAIARVRLRRVPSTHHRSPATGAVLAAHRFAGPPDQAEQECDGRMTRPSLLGRLDGWHDQSGLTPPTHPAASVVEGAGYVDVRDIDVPVLVRRERLHEAIALEGKLGRLAVEPASSLEDSVN